MHTITITFQLACRIYNETCYGGLARGYIADDTAFRYADDTTLIATSVTDMAELLKGVKVESELLGLWHLSMDFIE